jgi:hypothetical protein
MKIDPIDLFITNETDNIIDLYYDMENRFPYILNNMGSANLTCFIIDTIFELPRNTNQRFLYPFTSKFQNKTQYSTNHILFQKEYKNEINVGLMLINNYLYKFKNCSIDYNDWLEFIYHFN